MKIFEFTEELYFSTAFETDAYGLDWDPLPLSSSPSVETYILLSKSASVIIWVSSLPLIIT